MCRISAVLLLVCSVAIARCSTFGSDPLQRADSRAAGPIPLPSLDQEPLPLSIKQRLDHYDQLEERTWLQRYYENDVFYAKGGPLFVMVGFEGTAGSKPETWLKGGQMMELAQAFQANAFYIEQRFYGDSKPTVDISYKSLQYFTSEQSLADISVLITELRVKHPGAKVILFGGSIGGNLAAWARLKYPDIVDGAVVSSSPLLAQLEYPEFFEQVGLVMQQADPACLTDMRDAIQATADLFATDEGTLEMAELFNMCAPINNTNKMDIMNFNLIYADIYAAEVQKARSLDDVLVYCDYITNPVYGATPLDRLVQLTETFFPGFLPCAEIRFNPYKRLYSNPSWSGFATTSRRRQVVWQTCAWLGDFTVSNSPVQPFGDVFRSDIFVQICKDYYDESFELPIVEATVNKTNAMYGGLNPGLTKAVFIHGSFDPWRILGAREDISSTATAIVIEGASHLTDMETSDVTDSPQVTAARTQVKQLVSSWLQK